ncbi:type III-B CRISPR module RAMP protein Cmr4 [Thermaurantimonas aggregans]|uniref:Type III-B CRISPR module RAMP protein Cmr4 n=1 Tax=Thermaurantimonas aggregans TaxID=2173829 RepID=A0A401XLY0_9FLAO|nr:type III-B CRISPR module RAMP protein Cmr4 [Thermaurantimonas aggregans]GCD78002.1 type III-B CRISPR module RAMP protein Cmr4 [Thermaurantimonas aggregans]
MYKNARPLFLICETPLHVGSGSDLGIVDLPIQRERHTNFPKIEASSLKGALREAFESKLVLSEKDDSKAKSNLITINKAFGYDDGELGFDVKKRFSAKEFLKETFKENSQFSGCISITDARLLLFPVKSLYGVFAWITCPRVIKKFIADLELARITTSFSADDFNTEEDKTTSKAEILKNNNSKQQAYLEEFVFTLTKDTANGNVDKLAKWLKENIFSATDTSYWATKMEKDIIILSDENFRDFVTLATEVITRTKINNETGTVQQGALFSEEYLPAESVMYSLVMFSDEFSSREDRMTAADVKTFFEEIPNIVQIGGNATLGKGIVRTKFLTEKEKEVENA